MTTEELCLLKLKWLHSFLWGNTYGKYINSNEWIADQSEDEFLNFQQLVTLSEQQ